MDGDVYATLADDDFGSTDVKKIKPVDIKKLPAQKCMSPPTERLLEYETTCTDGKGSGKFSFNLFQTTKQKMYNMMRSYKFTPNYSPLTPIFSLGVTYDIGSIMSSFSDNTAVPFEDLLQKSEGAQEFFDAFHSLFWFTYRNRFPLLSNSSFTSDMGWGCMIRTGQMLVANGILKLALSTDWNYETDDRAIHDCILIWFLDYPGPSHPFSIHNIISTGSYFNVKPGDWLSPSIICHTLKLLVRKHKPFGLTMYVAKEGTVYIDAIEKLCENQENDSDEDLEDSKIFHPVIIAIPVRLGMDTVEECYYPMIKSFLCSPLSLGIIGGKPNSSLYFIGFQNEDVILLDPHTVQPTPPEDNPTKLSDTFHCNVPHKFPISQMDPSLALAFLCRTKKEFTEFCDMVEDTNQMTGDTIFEIKQHTEKQVIRSKEVTLSLKKG